MELTKKIQHLYSRASFGLSPDNYISKKGSTLNDELKILFSNAKSESQKPLKNDEQFSQMTSKKYSALDRKERFKMNNVTSKNKVKKLRLSWFERMSNEESALLERMSLFWHGHFACRLGKPHFAINQMNIFRTHGLGSFRELLHAISKDVAMIFYLNNQQNTKQQPNENFAREILELFTLGIGNYTENDIKNATKSFTGWAGDFSGKYVFKKEKHDFGQKIFLGKKGKFSGEEIIDIILENRQCATFITTKIYKYFVNEKVNDNHIKELSKEFYESDYNIRRLMNKIFRSSWFYEKENVLGKIKSPCDLLVDLSHSMNLKFDSDSLAFRMYHLGQILFAPPNVAGWNRGKEWISNASLVNRLNFSKEIIRGRGLNINLEEGNDEFGLDNEGTISYNFDSLEKITQGLGDKEMVEVVSDYLRLEISTQKLTKVLESTTSSSDAKFLKEIFVKLTSLPEFQMA